ncbi:MAG: hypothetical protein WD851_13600 [Pirellulales bacterium]
MATIGPLPVRPHDEEIQRAEYFEAILHRGLGVEEALQLSAQEFNVNGRTIRRANDYQRAFMRLSDESRLALAHLVNSKQIGVGLVRLEMTGDDVNPEGILIAWKNGEIPKNQSIQRDNQEVSASVPIDEDNGAIAPATVRQSYRIQAALGRCGERMGFCVWIPTRDRSNIAREWQAKEGTLLTRLPLNYDELTLTTIEEIDVLWLDRRSIVRAFEVEHTTSVYSGLLRMTDLLSLNPNLDINFHIVAPDARRKKVFEQITRPTFSCLEKAPLSQLCSFLSYSAVETIESNKLEHTRDTIIDEYADYPE